MTICTTCHEPCRVVARDMGIGAYDCGGAPGFDSRVVPVSDCCEAETTEEEAGAVSRREALQFIAGTNGRVFAVEFVKRTTGELRLMNCRLDVRKHLVRQYDGPPEQPGVTIKAGQLISVFDMVKKAYRSIPVDGITRIKIGGEWKAVKQD